MGKGTLRELRGIDGANGDVLIDLRLSHDPFTFMRKLEYKR